MSGIKNICINLHELGENSVNLQAVLKQSNKHDDNQ